MERAAIIGAGPSGLVAARYLKSEGFEPTLYEQGSRAGGQWSAEESHSGIWPTMHTNTSRTLTAFSDLPHAAGSPVYPSNQQIAAYLAEYADRFDLSRHMRLDTPVRGLRRGSGPEWIVSTDAGEESFSHVVVACGRFQSPEIPEVPGLDSFSGSGGVRHTFAYKHPEGYRGLRVLVAGGAISSLEIASDLAMLGAARVVVTQRRQRYVLPKLCSGVPTDHMMFTRYHALALESLPGAEVDDILKALVLGASGDPRRYGAPAPAESLAEAGLTLSQFYLPLVAEDRIRPRPWMESVDGASVRFADGSVEEFDAIVFGTGFSLDLPFLSEEIRAILDLDARHADLDRYTFHPDLAGLAFVGCFDSAGPYFPPIELQARWVAYSWSGTIAAPTEDELHEGIAAYRSRRGHPQKTRMDVASLVFARAARVEPDPSQHPELARLLLFGPLTPVSFRLSGPDALPDAPARIREQAAVFGCMPDPAFSSLEVQRLTGLAAVRDDRTLIRVVDSRRLNEAI